MGVIAEGSSMNDERKKKAELSKREFGDLPPKDVPHLKLKLCHFLVLNANMPLALENGNSLAEVSKEMGHGNTDLTYKTYYKFSKREQNQY